MRNLLLASIVSLPMTLGLTPSGRWGHQAVYMPSEAAMYIIGGQVGTSSLTNDVLVMPLNLTDPTFNAGSSDGLPAHAFASAAITPDSSEIVVLGGKTESCSSDTLAHVLDTDSGEWTSVTPTGMIRRRGAGMAWVDSGTSKGAMMVVGGISDNLACATSTAAYTAGDVLSLPLAASSLISSRSIPTSLTGSSLAIADYAMTSINGTVYLMGGQSATGSLVSLATIGVWTSKTGWTSQQVSGAVPSGRVGASLVAHPTLDLLILHGGSITSSGTDTPTALLSLLNTTSWTWSSPSTLQLPSSSASSYHSAIMTPSGVMITAFGLSTSGTARSDIHYLDMRDPTGAAWSWQTSWTQDMLQAYSASTSTVTTNTNTNTGSEVVAGSSGSSNSAPSKSKVVSIVIPVLLVLLIGLPILVLFIRRRVRLAKKRRMARHFSFSSQEDSGDLQGVFSEKHRKTKTQYSFGRDANERDGNVFSDLAGGLRGIMKRYSGSSTGNEEEFTEKEMRQMTSTRPLARLPSKSVNWEEIDFGLGKVDERRVSSTSAISATPTSPLHGPLSASSSDAHEFASAGEVMNMPLLINFHDQRGSPISAAGTGLGSPMHDGQMPLIPSLVVMPPTNPNTPAPAETSLAAYPALVPGGTSYSPDPFADPIPAQQQHVYQPTSDASVPSAQQESLDWSLLAKELEDRPAFRSISPTSTLRSHQHQGQAQPSPTSPNSSRPLPRPSRVPVPQISKSPQPGQIFPSGHGQPRHVSSPVTFPVASPSPSPSSPLTRASPKPELRSATPPQLPPLNLGSDPSFSRTITLVNPKTGRRTSEIQSRPSSTSALPYLSSGSLSPPPPQDQISRDLLPARRGSLPMTGFTLTPPISTSTDSTPSSSASTTPTPATVDAFTARRSSTPIPVPAGQAQAQPRSAPGSPTAGAGGARRASAQAPSRLRVVNPTEGESEDESTEAGKAV